MNKNAMVGLVLVIAAGVLAGLCASAQGGFANGLFGKAVWYLPYAVLVAGVRNLARARTGMPSL